MNEREPKRERTLEAFIASLKPDTPNLIAATAGAGIAMATVVGIYTPSSIEEAVSTYGAHIVGAGSVAGVLGYVLASAYEKE